MEAQSIEDIILSKYVNELSADGSVRKKVDVSPYQQPLKHTNILASHRSLRGGSSHRSKKLTSQRSRSSDRSNGLHQSRPSKEKLLHQKQEEDGNKVEPAAEDKTTHSDGQSEDDDELESIDPGQQPVRRKRKKRKPAYLQSPEALVVTAFRNGDRSTSSRVSAQSFPKLLESCTHRLHLPSSARRLFLKNGVELKYGDNISRGTEVYVSMGEAFKDPIKILQKNLSFKNEVTWTLSGLNLPANRKKEFTKPVTTSGRLESKASLKRVLVFPNGSGLKGCEMIADLDDIKGFMQNCVQKFDTGQQIKKLYLMNGERVDELRQIPEIHNLLNNSAGTPLLGPVWVSKGEDLSPSGVEEYIIDVMKLINHKKKASLDYLEELQQVQYADDRKEVAKQVRRKGILSMGDEELEEEIDKEEERQSIYDEFLKELKKELKPIRKSATEERENGSKFTMQHIAVIKDNHRLVSRNGVGYNGMRLKVFENGNKKDYITVFFNIMEAERGLKSRDEKSKTIIFQRFLDSLSFNSHLSHLNPKSRGILVKRVFKENGNEVTDVRALEYDDEIWISYGENWIESFLYCIQTEISKVILLKKDNRTELIRTDVPLPLQSGQDRSSSWVSQNGVPNEIEQHDVSKQKKPSNSFHSDDDDDEKEVEAEEAEEEEEEDPPNKEAVPQDCMLLQNKRDTSLCLFLEPVVGVMKEPKEQKQLWPNEGRSQEWLVHESGSITLKAFPRLALSLTDFRIETKVEDESVEGFLVQFSKLEKDSDGYPNQKWTFHPDGLIYSEQSPDLALTYLGGVYEKPESRPNNEAENGVKGFRNMLAACYPLEKKKKYQQFGLRQTQFKDFGQWRQAEIKNPKWSKLAILWPTDLEGKWVKCLKSPLEVSVIALAPSMKRPPRGKNVPKRFFCLKNGERNEDFGVCVTAPDLTNMKKDRQLKRQTKQGDRRVSHDGSMEEDYLHVPHCTEWTVRNVESKIFLETCTSLLGLPSAARRIFDKNGREHKDLDTLERDEKLYISMGEPWSDPKLTKSQLEARAMLVKLSEDVEKIRSYVSLKQTQSLVLAAESLSTGSVVGVSRDRLTKKEKRAIKLQQTESPPDMNLDTSDDDEELQQDSNFGLSAHDRACRRSDERKNQLQWPWEKIVNNDLDRVAEENVYGDAPPADRLPPVSKDLSLKQFIFDEGFLCCANDRDLVLTAAISDARVQEVTLEKRRVDNPNQKWSIKESGFIVLKYSQNSALTLQLPKPSGFGSQLVRIESSKLTVQPLRRHQFGRANQMFALNKSRNTIMCMASNPLDVAVTIANQVGCCSYAVVPRDYAMDQPGYTVYLPSGSQQKFQQCTVCLSCARSLRGKYKLQKLSQTESDFSCTLGPGRESGLKESGSLTTLQGKVDLTEGEDLVTLRKWQQNIDSMRRELSVRAINSKIAQSKTPRPIRVLAYRNGEGRLCQPIPVFGSSIQGIMDQCQIKLGFSWPVRKLFLEDGTPVQDIEDLRCWCEINAGRVRERQQEIEAGKLQPELDQIRQDAAEQAEQKKSPNSSSDELQSPTDTRRRQAADAGKSDSVDDDLEPRLTKSCFVIGSQLIDPTNYKLSISIYSLSMLDHIVPQHILSSAEPQFQLRYSIFGQSLTTEPFADEESFEGEGRDIMLRSEVPQLRLFFQEKFKLLKINLIQLPEESVIATSYVPLDGLIREEHEDFLTSLHFAGDYAWYKKSATNPKGSRTHASVNVEVNLSVTEMQDDPNDDSQENAFTDTGATGTESLNEQQQQEEQQQQGGQQVTDSHLEAEALFDIEELSSLCIELWASSGEAFVPLRTAHREFKEMVRKRRDLQDVITSKEVNKHVLKMMQGRRLQQQEPPSFRSTTDPANPVAVEGGWQTPRGDELMVEREIQQQEEREADIRAKQKQQKQHEQQKQTSFDFDRELYRQSSMQRVRVFQNGEDPSSAVTVWAESLHQILDNATVRLALRRPAKIVYSVEGKQLADFGSVSKDQLLCVSCGEAFQQPKASLQNVEIKANWGRARRMYGPSSTNFQIQARNHPLVGVDPFGPPLHSRRPTGATSVPTYDSKRIQVYENGRHSNSSENAWGDSLEALLRSATQRLRLRSPAVCFYNADGHKIVSFNEISRDDKLAVSTTGKGYIRN